MQDRLFSWRLSNLGENPMEQNINQTPYAQRLHIGIFGNTNSGKSSLLNAITLKLLKKNFRKKYGRNAYIVRNIRTAMKLPLLKLQ